MALNVIPFVPDAPYRDTSLDDRLGEKWRTFPGLEGYYLLSNFGRVKRLERKFINAAGFRQTTTEKIILAQVNRDRNLACKDWSFRPQVRLQVERISRNFQINRMVYYAFVAPFPLNDKNYVVVSRDGNGLNSTPENLVLLTYKERNLRQFTTGRHQGYLSKDKLRHIRMIVAGNKVKSVTVSRYGEDGALLESFSSIKAAAIAMGYKRDRIDYALNRPVYKLNGDYWRKGEASRINFSEINKILRKRRNGFREKRGKKVIQCDAVGNEIKTFPAISIAAKEVGISHKCIAHAAKGKVSGAGGFTWRFL